MTQPIPTPFTDGINSVLNAAICEVLSSDENAAKLLFGSLGDRPTALRNALAAIKGNACSQFLDPDELLPPPFTGGQCDNVLYNCRVESRVFSQSQQQYIWQLSNIFQIRGPLTITGGETGGSCVSPNATAQAWIVESPNDNPRSLATGCSDVVPSYRNFTATRADGQPDDCGDPSLVPPGFIGGPVTFEGDTIINIDGGTQITIPTGVIFAPVYVDLDGSLNFPISVDLGGINFDGTLELFPDFSVELFPNGLNPGAGSSDDGDDLADPSPSGPETPPDDPDDPRRIIGVQITAQVPDSAIPTEIAFTNGPAILAPRLGSCRFLVLVNDFSGWTNDIDIKGTETYIPCPVPQGAIAVRCSPAPGVSLQFTPVRGRVRNG